MILGETGLNKLRARCQLSTLGHAKSLRRAQCLAKKKKPLDLQTFSRIGKNMKKL